MEVQDRVKSDWRRYFCNQPPVEFDTSHVLCSELGCSSMRPEESSAPYCSIWTDADQWRVESCNSRSFAMDARIRLDSLKSGCKSPSTGRVTDGMPCNCKCETEQWDSEESQDEECALDSVELLDVEDDVQDEEKWLYESPMKRGCAERTESALRWCRHVLDNRSPETEAACRSLINKLGRGSSSDFCRRPAVFHRAANVSVGSSMDRTHAASDSTGNNELNQDAHSSTTFSYRLQDITDVHIMARMQEASLRQDYVSTPSPRRGTEPPVTLPSYFNTAVEDIDELTPGSKTEAPASSCWQPGLLSSSPCQSVTSAAEQGCQSPKLARLHQQVTQFKLLKLAQSQATSAGRTRSPLRTSLRSLQAVRNSRSLETDDYQPADSQITYPPSGASSVMKGSGCWSPALSDPFTSPNSPSRTARDSLDRTAAVRRLQRSQSVSPCRIPHPARGYLSAHGRVFASPERSTTAAWQRNAPSKR